MAQVGFHIANTPQEAGRDAATKGADLLRHTLAHNHEASIILATGASQFDLLEHLVAAPDIDWRRVTGFHLDEYIDLPNTHPASFCRYLQERFVSKLPVPLKAFHFLDSGTEPASEINRINQIISKQHIDVAFIGIGENGHIAFNDPPADFETEMPYLIVELDEACRRQQWKEGWFATLEAVPRQAISMSVVQIMKSKSIVCTVPDTRKAVAVQHALEGRVTPIVPASILQQHPDCYFFLDQAAASLLS